MPAYILRADRVARNDIEPALDADVTVPDERADVLNMTGDMSQGRGTAGILAEGVPWVELDHDVGIVGALPP